MLWLFFILIAELVWSCTNILNKHVFEKYHKDVASRMIVYGFVSAVTAMLILVFSGKVQYSNFGLIAVGLGLLYVVIAAFYFKVIIFEEISRIAPFQHFIALFSILFAVFLLGESFKVHNYLGITLLIAGAVLLSVRKGGEVKFSKWFVIVLIGTFLLAGINVVSKYLLGIINTWDFLFWIHLGTFLGILPIWVYYRKSAKKLLRAMPKAWGIMAFTESMAMIAYFMFVFALSLGPLALIATLGEIQPAIILGIVIVLSRFKPHILKEELGKGQICVKAAAIAIMFIGTMLII